MQGSTSAARSGAGGKGGQNSVPEKSTGGKVQGLCRVQLGKMLLRTPQWAVGVQGSPGWNPAPP